jgi:hypothetical protein
MTRSLNGDEVKMMDEALVKSTKHEYDIEPKTTKYLLRRGYWGGFWDACIIFIIIFGLFHVTF